MVDASEGRARLTSDMLTQCADELRAKSEECDALKFENARLTARQNIYDAKVARLEATLAEERALTAEWRTLA